MSKDKLKLIIDQIDKINDYRDKDDPYWFELLDYFFSGTDFGYLIDQAERAQELEIYVDENTKKHAKLNVFLQERDTTLTLGMHVIDAVMKYVQELEHQNDVLNDTLSDMPGIQKGYMKNIEKQNKRYREFINELKIACGQPVSDSELYEFIQIELKALEDESWTKKHLLL